eukprot:TRINITY_DN8652_c0_g1_i1.p1 TRINITY_DN8652_c0_g1~~TRINITY_DN8652_c0_g1_i1.p1  ORF type:complete len:478 (+),score=100.72 TRINITY_DN8652_c0_g1_i1:104-1537(+)
MAMDRVRNGSNSVGASISEKWATFSMPGSIRRAKTVMLGVGPMPNDPFEAHRNELDEYESLLCALGACSASLQSAVTMMSQAPRQLFDPLAQLYQRRDGASKAHSVARLCNALDHFSKTTREKEQQVSEIQEFVQSLRGRNAELKQLFHDRDSVWKTQDHYSKKTDGIREQIMKGGGGATPKLAEKLHRNQEKLKEQNQEFSQITAEAGRQVEDVLRRRWQEVPQTLGKICQYYVAVFQASGQLLAEIKDVQVELNPSAAQAMASMGQEMASQAKERMNSFADSLRTKLDAATSKGAEAGSSPVQGEVQGMVRPQAGASMQGVVQGVVQGRSPSSGTVTPPATVPPSSGTVPPATAQTGGFGGAFGGTGSQAPGGYSSGGWPDPPTATQTSAFTSPWGGSRSPSGASRSSPSAAGPSPWGSAGQAFGKSGGSGYSSGGSGSFWGGGSSTTPQSGNSFWGSSPPSNSQGKKSPRTPWA